jgi:hypothetical protein
VAYSTRFWIGQLPTAWGSLYTVPAGYVVVLRDMEFTNYTASALTVSLAVETSGTGGVYLYTASVPANAHVQWTGRTVMDPGDVLQGLSSSGGLAALISGYLLTEGS